MTTMFKNPLCSLNRRLHRNNSNGRNKDKHQNNKTANNPKELTKVQRSASWHAGRTHGLEKGHQLFHNNNNNNSHAIARRPFLLGRRGGGSFRNRKKSESAPFRIHDEYGDDSSLNFGGKNRRLSSETFAMSAGQVSQDLYPKQQQQQQQQNSIVSLCGVSAAALPDNPWDKTEHSTERNESSSFSFDSSQQFLHSSAKGNAIVLSQHPPLHQHSSLSTVSTSASTLAVSLRGSAAMGQTATTTTATTLSDSSSQQQQHMPPVAKSQGPEPLMIKSVHFSDQVQTHDHPLDASALAECNLWYTDAERSRFRTLNEVLARHINQKAASAHNWKQQHPQQEQDAPSPPGTTCLFWLATLERVYDALCTVVEQDGAEAAVERKLLHQQPSSAVSASSLATSPSAKSASPTSLLSKHKRRALRKLYEAEPHPSSPSSSFQQQQHDGTKSQNGHGPKRKHESLCPLGLEHIIVEWIKEDRFCRRLEQMEMVHTVKATMHTPYSERSNQFIQETSQSISRLSTLLAQETALALASSERALRRQEAAQARLRCEAEDTSNE